MVNELRFIPVKKRKAQHYELLASLMLPYHRELDGDPPGDELVLKITRSMMDMLGPRDRRLELVMLGDEPVGFFYGKIDHENHRGFVKPGYGYVMELYVRPEYRRKGYASAMLQRLDRHFARHGAAHAWLTTGSTGEAFWRAASFAPTGEICPDNGMDVFEKELA